IARTVGFPRAEREPGREASPAAKPAAADEDDQRGRVHRTHTPDHLPGDPHPAAAIVSPAPIMEGREAPRRVIHPGPAPRLDPGPMTVAVGRPADGHGARRPHRTVV